MPGLLGALAAVVEQVELARGVGVGVDGEQAAEVAGQLEQPVGGSRRSGRRVDLDGDVVLDARLEDRPRVELATAGGCPGCRSTSRPVQWPSTLVNGLRTAATIRRVIGAASIRSLECTLATRTSSRPSISSVWSRAPSSRMSTSMPLSRVKAAAEVLVDRVDHAELARPAARR